MLFLFLMAKFIGKTFLINAYKYGLIYFQQSLPVSLPEFCENFFRRNTTKESMDRRL